MKSATGLEVGIGEGVTVCVGVEEGVGVGMDVGIGEGVVVCVGVGDAFGSTALLIGG